MIMKLLIKIKTEKSANKRGGQYFQHHEDLFPIISYFKALIFGNELLKEDPKMIIFSLSA